MVADLGTVVSIWAHPDDETYLAATVMATAVQNGQRVVCVSMTAGEHGTDDPVTWPPARLDRLRRWEAAAAMAVLGVADHRIVGFPDGGLKDIDIEVGIAAVTAVLDEVRPDTILTFGPDGMTFHPDHRTVSWWVTEAWRRRGRRGRLLHAAISEQHLAEFGERYESWGVYMTDERPVGVGPEEVFIELHAEGADLDRKLAALDAMASQTRAAVDVLGREAYARDIAVECFVECAQ